MTNEKPEHSPTMSDEDVEDDLNEEEEEVEEVDESNEEDDQDEEVDEEDELDEDNEEESHKAIEVRLDSLETEELTVELPEMEVIERKVDDSVLTEEHHLDRENDECTWKRYEQLDGEDGAAGIISLSEREREELENSKKNNERVIIFKTRNFNYFLLFRNARIG